MDASPISWSNGLNLHPPRVAPPPSPPHIRRKKAHVINELYDRGMDYNLMSPPPKASFMLATVPRSGSTYCAIQLWQTGMLGAPMEYLNFPVMRDMFKRLGYATDEKDRIAPECLPKFWNDIQRLRTSPNGIFGYKMFTANFNEIAKEYPDFLAGVTPNYIVYLTRNDLLGQAISYSRAQRSKVWFGDMPNTPVPDYDAHHLRACIASIRYQKAFWERVFEITNVSPLRITYEDLLEDDAGTISRVVQHLGLVEDPSARINVPCVVRQSDEVSVEWRYRFLSEVSVEEREMLLRGQ